MEERRQPPPRHRTLKRGKIVFNRRSSVIDCRVWNESDLGACLQVQSQLGVPPRFDLILEQDDHVRAAQVVWRNADRLGVKLD